MQVDQSLRRGSSSWRALRLSRSPKFPPHCQGLRRAIAVRAVSIALREGRDDIARTGTWRPVAGGVSPRQVVLNK